MLLIFIKDAFEILKDCVNECPEKFYNLQFSVNTEYEENLFWIRRDLKTVYVNDEEFHLTKKLVRKALGIEMPKIWTDGMMGVVVGDALRMPVQFADRVDLKINPVKTMEGYGTYNMPPGTWSDDSSMSLATLDSIREKGEVNYPDIMTRFSRWLFDNEYTPAGKAFDQGNTCTGAICKYVKERNYRTCGKTGEMANGNGALMRSCRCAFMRMKQSLPENGRKSMPLNAYIRFQLLRIIIFVPK